jgi:DNA-binding PadR family transcriptional regulator
MVRGWSHRGGHLFKDLLKESPFQKGDLKYVILDLLKEKPRYGYEIIRELDERSHGFYAPSPGVVYPTLQMLEEMGHARSIDRDGKKVYEITEEGNNFLSERKDSADEVRSQMKRHWNFKGIAKMAIVMKDVHGLERLIGHRFRHATEEQIEQIHNIIERAYGEIEKILED